MTDRSWDQFVAADPARDAYVPAGDVEDLLRRAARDITPYHRVRPARRRPTRFIAVGVVFAAVLAVGSGIVVLRPEPRQALVPGVAPSGSCLTPIANHIAPTAYDKRAGKYDFVHSSGISGDTTGTGGGGFVSETFSVESRTWTAEDGSGRIRTMSGPPSFPDEVSRTFYASHPTLAAKAGPAVQDLRAGEAAVEHIPAADPAAMARQLYQPRENGPSEAIVGVGDLNRTRVLDTAHRAAVLEFLAATNGVLCLGTVTDPTGRSGVEIGADRGNGPMPSPGDHVREYLLIDPGTGEVLASGTSFKSDTPTWSTVFLERGRTDTLG